MAGSRHKRKATERSATRPVATTASPPLKHNPFREWWLWYSGEYAASMMEPWEIALIHAVMFLFLASLFFAIRSFMPSHLRTIAHRARYYIYGDVSGLTPLSGEQW